jgi:hypothetical protein
MVYTPCRFAAPSTNTRMERISPIETLARTPIIWRSTRDSMLAFTPLKRCPLT